VRSGPEKEVGFVFSSQGDSAAAPAFARRAKDAAALCPALALRAHVLAEIGRLDEAAALADEAVDAAAGPGVLPSFWTADLAEALHELGRRDGLPAPNGASSR
jgi:hypothetical protein